MFAPIKVADLELTEPLHDLSGLSRFDHAQFLVRWRGRPVGHVKVPVRGDVCRVSDIIEAVADEFTSEIFNKALACVLENSVPFSDWQLEHLLKFVPDSPKIILPAVSVAVCTRDRPRDLALCLAALQKLEFTPLEILVIDNAPKTTATKNLVEQFFPNVRYVLEPRPGLDFARNRAIAEARGEILAYTDDDVIVDSLWTKNLAAIFAEHREVMAVTGLVVPHELETEPQFLFEEYGGFGRGFNRRWFRFGESHCRALARDCIGSGQFGTGANMSFRRDIFSEIGGFDPALDVGTVTQGGGDLDMFFRVLKFGHTLVYEPAAMVRHRHRRDFAKLATQIASNGIGFYSHVVRNALAFPEERRGIIRFGLWWFCHWDLRRWLKALFKPSAFPRKLIWAELRGCFAGLFRYQKARRNISRDSPVSGQPAPDFAERSSREGVAIRMVDIALGIKAIDDVAEYAVTRIFVTSKGSPVAQFDLANHGQPISVSRLTDAIIAELGLRLVAPCSSEPIESIGYRALAALQNHLRSLNDDHTERKIISSSESVSIIVATCNRPKELWRCLDSLTRQVTSRDVEIIVVDNCPGSSLTPVVVEQFPQVRLVNEPRAGVSYARNAGFNASRGAILVSADDDIVAPPDWLEKLIAPLARNDVKLVSGNVLPAELETASQVQFEIYGGLCRGFEPREFTRDWFDSFRRRAVPTWEIGGTANLAFRADILADAEIGLLDETLGPGTSTGVGEDTYFFYRILKAGHTIVYHPGAFVWHQHRVTENALRKQIYNYSKGHVAYHVTTFLRDGDGRGLVRVLAELPLYHLWQIKRWILGNRERTLATMWDEIRGNLAGPWTLWRSRRRVKQLGRSSPHTPVFKPPPGAFETTEQSVETAPSSHRGEMEAITK